MSQPLYICITSRPNTYMHARTHFNCTALTSSIDHDRVGHAPPRDVAAMNFEYRRSGK